MHPMGDLHDDWLAAIRRADYAAAWSINDAVLAARDPAGRDDPKMPYHARWVWDGRCFDGRHVLVRCYHGLGDTLQFARYLRPLRRRVASLTVEAPPELLGVLSSVAGPDQLVAFDPSRPLPPAECDIEIMELPHALRLTPEAVPPPYISADAAPVDRDMIGLCWAGGKWDPQRAIPERLMLPLASDRCIALRPGPTSLPVLNPGGCPSSVAATAAIIAGLPLVISVDTMVAHLVGAMGRPVWLLLKHEADWRWMQGERCPWYPSMRLFRQPEPGDWPTVIAQVAREMTCHSPASIWHPLPSVKCTS